MKQEPKLVYISLSFFVILIIKNIVEIDAGNIISASGENPIIHICIAVFLNSLLFEFAGRETYRKVGYGLLFSSMLFSAIMGESALAGFSLSGCLLILGMLVLMIFKALRFTVTDLYRYLSKIN